MRGTAKPRPALLLVGPPGAGKSPLGDALERRTGWIHFDLGARLRAIAGGEDDHGLSDGEQAFVRDLLAADALFPDDQFPLVRQIVQTFLCRRPSATGVVLNGLPRTVGQAERLRELLDIRRVVVLECRPDLAAARVGQRRAGATDDHAGRPDDEPDRFRQRLEIYERETPPLIELYRTRGVGILTLAVGPDTDSERLAALIAERLR